MIYYLIGIVVAVAVFSLVTNSSFAAEYTVVTISSSHKSVLEGENFVLSGYLRDRNWDPIRNAEIFILEIDKSGGTVENEKVAMATTDSNGGYQISVTAKYWDGTGNTVELLALYATDSAKSQIITVNILEPNSGATSRLDCNPCAKFTPQLSLQVQDGTGEGTIQVKPTLTYGSGIKLATNDVSIYVDGNYKTRVSSNLLSSNIYTGSGHHTIKASIGALRDSLASYDPSSDTETYFVKATTSGNPAGPPSSGSSSGTTSSGSSSGTTSSGSSSGTTSSGSSSGTTISGSSSGITSSDSFPIGYVIAGVAVAAVAAGVGIALSKRKKITPMVYTSPANIPMTPTSDDTQFWVCPNCGKDTQYKNGEDITDKGRVQLSDDDIIKVSTVEINFKLE